MALDYLVVRIASSTNLWKEARTERFREGIDRLERPPIGPKHFIPIESRHSYGGNLASPLAKVQIWSAGDIDAGIGQVHGALRVVGKVLQKLVSQGNHLMRLLTLSSNPPRHNHVAAFPVCSPVGIARQGSRRKPLPCHHCSRIQSARERYSNPLFAIEVTG